MAKPSESTGSDVTELKMLFRLAQSKPVNAAFGLDSDGKVVVKLDKKMKSKALAQALADAKVKPVYRGTVSIDPNDITTANFSINKAVSGIQGKLLVALKGSGVTKVNITVGDDAEDEDGRAADDGEPADQGESPAHTAGQAAPPPPDTPAAPAPSAPAPAEAASEPRGPDASALTRDLAGLVRQMMGMIATDPSRKTTLAGLATSAQTSLKSGNLNAAQQGIDALRSALSAGATAGGTAAPAASTKGSPTPASNAPQAATASGAPDPATAPGAPDPATVRMLQKSHQAWTATRTKIDAEMKKLVKSVLSASEGEDDDDFEQEFQSVVAPLVTTLDTTLSDLLAQAAAAKDGDEHERLMKQARSTLTRYRKFVDSSPIIAHLDGNPFVPLAIGKTLDATLSALSKIIQ